VCSIPYYKSVKYAQWKICTLRGNRVPAKDCNSKYNFHSLCRTRGHVETMNLFPMFVKLHSRRCLVVGAGKISERKIAGLLAAGAIVRVVAPDATPRIRRWHRERNIRWEPRGYRSSDLRGNFLVVAATSSTKLHRQIFRDAQRRGALCNIVDVPELCDFYYPAIVRRGELQIAISTGGASPALAKNLRQKLEKQFGPEYARWLKHLAQQRKKIYGSPLHSKLREHLLRAQVSESAFASFLKKRAKVKHDSHKKKSRR
jgi:precorrin-2 dehydrogenase / sirohydrochlorin ferrochelatase